MKSKRFIIYLDDGGKYFMEINYNFCFYRIKHECLYKGLKNLGKIIGIEVVIWVIFLEK